MEKVAPASMDPEKERLMTSDDVEEGARSATLSWSGVTAFVADPAQKGTLRKVLDGVGGQVSPGEILAIMGPSGAGKTTLLNVLAGRPTLGDKGKWEGAVKLDGIPVDECPHWKRSMGYVMQRDIFLEELTLRDTLSFTADMRLPYEWSAEKKREKMESIVQLAGLGEVLDTRIGTGIERGLSGGEVKRTSIVSELLALPRLLLLDEPLTGLDSSRAADVLGVLRHLAKREKRTVLLTIHQPSSDVFALFDRLLFMAPGGRIVFDGMAADAIGYFSSLGHSCPTNWNPTDFFMKLVMNKETADQLSAKHDEHRLARSAEPGIDESIGLPGPLTANGPLAPRPLPPFFYQVMLLSRRGFLQTGRFFLKPVEWVLNLFVALLLGGLWWQAGTGEKVEGDPDRYVSACFFFVAHWCWYSLFQGIQDFPKHRDVLTKDRASEAYSISAFFVARILCEAPVVLCLPLFFFVIAFPMIGFPVAYSGMMFLTIAVCIQIVAAMSMLISVAVFDASIAVVVAVITMLTTMCTAGYFIDMSTLPHWLSYVKYSSFWRYSMGLFLHYALKGNEEAASRSESLRKYDFSELSPGENFVVLLSFALVFRVLAYIVLMTTKRTQFS